jgi:hypothetical protein
MTDTQHEKLVQAYRELAVFFASTVPVKLDRFPSKDEVNAVKENLVNLAAYVDTLVEQTADYVQERTGFVIDGACKRAQLFDALDGNLLYEVECAADQTEGGR